MNCYYTLKKIRGIKMDKLGKKLRDSVIVSHPAQQHSYRLAAAIEKNEMLHSYCTTVYYRPNKLLYLTLSKLLSQDNVERMIRRKLPFLDYKLKQFNELTGLLYLYIMRKDKKGKISSIYGNYLGGKFGKSIAKYAKKNNVKAVVAYDRFAYNCFQELEGTDIIRILDMSSIPVKTICDIIARDLPNSGTFSGTYYQQLQGFYQSTIQRSIKEIQVSDYFLVASEFVKNILIEENVEEEKIFIARYGADISRFSFETKKRKKSNEKVIFLFVGRLTAAKGIHYLLEAFKQLNRDDIELRVAGSMMNNEPLFEQYRDYFTYLGEVPNHEMPDIYKQSDIFVLPTMYDGASLAIVEALASGLPVISTQSAGNSELITDGKDGFVIPTGEIDPLMDKIIWFAENKDKIVSMALDARKTAELNTWDKYDEGIKNAFNYILSNEVKK
jgi:glycosyltransferase involved in cell wall biosynthesis